MILEELLAARKRAKKVQCKAFRGALPMLSSFALLFMKAFRLQAMAEATDPLTKSVLNGRQTLGRTLSFNIFQHREASRLSRRRAIRPTTRLGPPTPESYLLNPATAFQLFCCCFCFPSLPWYQQASSLVYMYSWTGVLPSRDYLAKTNP